MKNKIDMTKQIARLQENLHSIRKIAGWTAEDLGNKIGVTKQTISNIENAKVKLTQTQYIAIRAVLEYEVKENPGNVVLAQVIPILLDNEFEDEEKNNKIKEAVKLIGNSSVGGSSVEQLAIVSNALLNPLLDGVGNILGGAIGAFSWLAPTKGKNKKK